MKNNTRTSLGTKMDVVRSVRKTVHRLSPDYALIMIIGQDKYGACFASIVTEGSLEDIGRLLEKPYSPMQPSTFLDPTPDGLSQ